MNAWSRQRDGQASLQRLTVGLVCAWGLFYAGSTVAATPRPYTVVIDGSKFEPGTLTVKSGATVRWINKDPFPHTVTASGIFNSHAISPGRSWKYTARKAGEYVYICTLHPNMKGILKVE